VLASRNARPVALALCLLATGAVAAAAAFSSAASVAEGVASGSLAPPTGVAANCVALTNKVTVSWTPTISPLARGYAVLRSTATGGPYSLIATVSGSASTSYTDTIGLLQTQYYVVESTRDNWTSPISNQSGVHSISLGICSAA